jgi:hypothetical protein
MDNVAGRRIPSNPYIVENPIRSRDMFFGREDDFQFVARKVGEDRSNQIAVLCGERRSGKTSILFQILGGRLGGAFLPILIDMQMLAGIKGDQEFFSAILKAGCAALADAGLTMERLEAGTDGTVEALFEAFLQYARSHAPGRLAERGCRALPCRHPGKPFPRVLRFHRIDKPRGPQGGHLEEPACKVDLPEDLLPVRE